MKSSIDQFYQLVAKNPSMIEALTANAATQDELIERAMAMGKENGLAFSRDEAQAWLEAQVAAERSGELSDIQLEAVAGGKGSTMSNADSGALGGAIVGGILGGVVGVVAGPMGSVAGGEIGVAAGEAVGREIGASIK